MPLTRRDFVRSLFAASQTALVGRLMTAPLFADDTGAGRLNFAVIGDWGAPGPSGPKAGCAGDGLGV